MLDEFSATKIADPSPSSAATAAPRDVETGGSAQDEEDFAKQLQAGMAELLGQFGTNPEMQAELENMMKELGGVASKGGPAPAAPVSQSATKEANKPKKSEEDNFQDAIRKTMERMQNSGESASAAVASSEEDMLAQMLKEMEKGNFPGMDGGNEEDFNKMLMGMMEQLTNKEILYEPMKDLHDKFPDWLEKNKDKTKAADLERYMEQKSLVDEIVARFEKADYSDDNKEDRDFIVDRMQKVRTLRNNSLVVLTSMFQMQAAGSPPPDLVGDLGSAQDALSEMDGGCTQQ